MSKIPFSKGDVNREKEKVSTTRDITNFLPIIFDVFTFYVCTRSLKTLNVDARVYTI